MARATPAECSRLGQGEAAGSAAARSRAAAAVGLLPRCSESSHLRGSSLLFFFK